MEKVAPPAEDGKITRNLSTFRTLLIVKASFNCLLILVGLLYSTLGSVLGAELRADLARSGERIPFDPTIIFVSIGVFLMIIGAVLAVLTFMASSKMNLRQSRTFIIVVVSLNCLTGILGILLCIFTVIELQKEEVKAVFKS